MRKHVCLFCGGEATLLCDYMLGYDRDAAHAIRRPTDKSHTCDLPVCRGCAKAVGFVCGEQHDTFDVCPVHADSDWLTEHRDALVTAADVKAWRRRIALAITNGMDPVAARGIALRRMRARHSG